MNRLKFILERYLVRGARYQLLAVAGMIGLISLAGGILVRFDARHEETLGEGVWWAFLRLTDPGYLGDDVGLAPRVISTVLTVLGYVLFMGSLVAIMTQWLNATLRRLEAGLTPVVRKNHVLVLGWTGRAGTVVADLFRSEGRLRRFLERRGARQLHVVVLAEEVGPRLVQELKERIGDRWNPKQVTLRSGSPLRGDHLARVDFLNASVVLVPVGEFSRAGPETADTRTIKTLLSMSNHPLVTNKEQLPLVVVELFDARKADLARGAYAGPIEVLASDATVSRLIAQNIRHQGLSHVYNELLTHGDGNELYVRVLAQCAGSTFASLVGRFPKAVLLGVVREEGRDFKPYLNPAQDFVIEAQDRLVLVARAYEDSEPSPELRAAIPQELATGPPMSPPPGRRRMLVLGWNHRVPALLTECASYRTESFHIDVVSMIPAADRQAVLARHELDFERLELAHIHADYTVPKDLKRVKPESYDNIIMMGSDWVGSGEESDARTIVGYLLLQEVLAGNERPQILIELLDQENVGLLGSRSGEVLISPLILSHMLAQVGLRRELAAVFDELFAAGGTEIAFHSASDYGVAGRTVTFHEVQAAARARNELALGVRIGGAAADASGLELNPRKTRSYPLTDADDLVLLSRERKTLLGEPG
ncbi:MAG: hypothetical protein OEM15_14515 [Myxococcales bacterium]|nr:hypothetical protein [Myxococcales bacterium]MDH3483230.1 hypothetical protein [Myxococcales bacterium]